MYTAFSRTSSPQHETPRRCPYPWPLTERLSRRSLLEQTPRQSANNLMLMDAKGDRAVVELGSDREVLCIALCCS